ncbi:MAG: hypothetical protein KDA65_10220 [Planctomycetaceae bacterium]|nr:hypothetical protein [Planctomycetaceae bacterium]
MNETRRSRDSRFYPPLRDSARKLALALLLILLTVLTPLSWWPAWGSLLLIEFILIARNPPAKRFWWTRFPAFLFFLASVSLSIPLSQHFEQGTLRGWTIFERGMLAFLATVWLTTVLSHVELLRVLRAWKLPAFLVEALAFMLRYLSLISTERKTLQQARAARTFHRGSLITTWRTSSYIIAAILIRAFDRADRIYQAMKARGWKGPS